MKFTGMMRGGRWYHLLLAGGVLSRSLALLCIPCLLLSFVFLCFLCKFIGYLVLPVVDLL